MYPPEGCPPLADEQTLTFVPKVLIISLLLLLLGSWMMTLFSEFIHRLFALILTDRDDQSDRNACHQDRRGQLHRQQHPLLKDGHDLTLCHHTLGCPQAFAFDGTLPT